MIARRLLPILLLVLVGCIPTSGSKCGSCSTPDETAAPTATESDCCTESAPCCSATESTTVDLKVVKYDQLTEEIRSHQGKVVVVDVWASDCTPCKKEFHHLVEMNQQFAKQGVVCISISVDLPENHAAAMKFLQKSEAKFANYRLDEPNTIWQEKWDLNGIPAVFVFDRDGKRAGKFTNDDPDNQFTYDRHVLPLVKKLAETK